MHPSTGQEGRIQAFGQELIEAHEWLRESLRELRAGVGSPGGHRPPDLPLRARCLAFCAAMTRHHTSEDATAFPALAAQFPELAPVLEELRRDHLLVADILRRAGEIAAAPAGGDGGALAAELDGLAAILESHFQWEERRITAALDRLDLPGTPASALFGVPEAG